MESVIILLFIFLLALIILRSSKNIIGIQDYANLE